MAAPRLIGSVPEPTSMRTGAGEVPASFHPAVEHWFSSTHGTPSEPQARGWPHIIAAEHTLIAAPTGSGKTLAAFLAAIDQLVWRGLAGELKDELSILYISPLKALSNDIEKNLQEPLRGIRESLVSLGYPPVEVRSVVRTGDTPASERVKLLKAPPHILVTTPESLYILLTSESGRAALASVHTVIIDEIHAMLADKRGAHLALSLERLRALARGRVTRIGLSATQKPIELVARFLVGGEAEPCAIVDCGHRRRMLLDLELPASPLEAVMSGEVWAEVYDRIAALVRENTTTLVFVSNRRLAERLCRHLAERLGEGRVMAHHGSLSKEIRLDAERRLKAGELAALVATASLELGIDIGAVDLVCQVGSPRSIARLLQRVGRAGHQLGGVPVGKLFPLSRNDLVECAALLDSVRRGELDQVSVRQAPLDILAQQIVAMVAAEDVPEETLFERVRRSYPYRALERERFDAVLEMLAEGYRTSRGRRSALIRHDRVTQLVQGRKAARLVALTNGGAIADNTDYRVVLEPEQTHVGSIGEDFAIESMAGDIFQLGNASWRILKVENGLVRVADARGEPPTIPFWLGEAPARSDELSGSVSRLKAELTERLEQAGFDPPAEQGAEAGAIGAAALVAARDWLVGERGLASAAADQLLDYLAAAKRTLGVLPTFDTIIVERFFDEAENTHLVVHSSFGARINRAWGLALRKRFCKTFNFELQAAATEDAIILSLGPTHSFELSSVGQFLHSNTAEAVLIQALLDAPMFEIRWRHNATRSLATPRFQSGKKVPANLVRIRANDLLTSAFPDQQACLENIVGEREVPDHPLVQQTIHDCLTEAMDCEGFLELLRRIESGRVRMVYRDLTEASPLSHEIINANPYAFLDPAPLEERRTQAIMTRRFFDPVASDDLGKLDADAIARVKSEAWPTFSTSDELVDALSVAGFMLESEALHGSGLSPRAASELFERLIEQGRATRVLLGRVELDGAAGEAGRAWVSADRLMAWRALCPASEPSPALALPAALAREWSAENAMRELLRARLGALGPITARALAEPFRALGDAAGRGVTAALLALEGEGSAMSGRFSPWASESEWCERGLLARIHRYTLQRLRREIEPVSSATFMRFLFAWQRVSGDEEARGRDALPDALALLEGYDAAAGAWESGLLAARVRDYDPSWLDAACLSGRLTWGRLHAPTSGKASRSLGSTPITIVERDSWEWLARSGSHILDEDLSPLAREALAHIERAGACLLHDLRRVIRDGEDLSRSLSELVAAGRITSDSFGGMRGLLPADKRRSHARRAPAGLESAGRWSLLPPLLPPEPGDIERWARLLVRRYGVVFRALLARENAPPWRDLLREYRRLEARGEIRGGRFVERHAGEQFALPEAIPLLRRQRHARPAGEELCINACDPLNLLGTLLPGARVAAAPTNAILFRDALPIAVLEGNEVRFLEPADVSEQRRLRARLMGGVSASAGEPLAGSNPTPPQASRHDAALHEAATHEAPLHEARA